MVQHTWGDQEVRAPDVSVYDAHGQVSSMLSTQQSTACYDSYNLSTYLWEYQCSLYIKTFILLDFSHGWIWKMAALNKKSILWLWTNKKLNNLEWRWIISAFRSWKAGRQAIQDEITNDFWSSPLQRCPHITKHTVCVLLPFVTTPSVLQQKQNKWIDLMVHLIWSLTQPHCSKC